MTFAELAKEELDPLFTALIRPSETVIVLGPVVLLLSTSMVAPHSIIVSVGTGCATKVAIEAKQKETARKELIRVLFMVYLYICN